MGQGQAVRDGRDAGVAVGMVPDARRGRGGRSGCPGWVRMPGMAGRGRVPKVRIGGSRPLPAQKPQRGFVFTSPGLRSYPGGSMIGLSWSSNPNGVAWLLGDGRRVSCATPLGLWVKKRGRDFAQGSCATLGCRDATPLGLWGAAVDFRAHYDRIGGPSVAGRFRTYPEKTGLAAAGRVIASRA